MKILYQQIFRWKKTLDDYFIEILQENNKHSTREFDNVFEKLQQCDSLTFGPL